MSDKDQFPYRTTILVNAVAEFFATLLFVFVGCGIAVISGPAIGALGIAIGFAFAMCLTALLFTGFNRVQFNPGLSIALYFSNMKLKEYAEEHHQYWYFDPYNKLTTPWLFAKIVGQLLGAVFGALLLVILILASINHVDPAKLGLAQNGWGVGFQSEFDFRGALLVELVGATALFYAIVRSLKNFLQPLVVAFIGSIAFLAMHIFTYSVTGTSLNFARSFGPEITSFFVRFGRLKGSIGSDIALTALCNSLIELSLFLLVAIAAGLLAGILARNSYPETERSRK